MGEFRCDDPFCFLSGAEAVWVGGRLVGRAESAWLLSSVGGDCGEVGISASDGACWSWFTKKQVGM